MKHLYLLLCLVAAVTVYAQMPRSLNYQGTLAIGSGPVPDGNYNVTFRLYTASSGGSAVWTESQLVAARNGVFNAVLGKVAALPVSFNTSYWMSLQVGADPELSPRLEMTAVAYSLQSAVADSATKIANNAITSAKILDGTITTADIADDAVTAVKIANGAGAVQAVGDNNTIQALTSTGKAFVSVVLNAPSAGYALVMGSCKLFVNHVNGTWDNVIAKISKTSGDVATPSSATALVRVPATWPSGGADYFCVPLSMSEIFPVSAGATTFYFNVYESSGTGNDGLTTPNISVLFVPTAYTTVAPPNAPQTPSAASGTRTDLGK